MSLLLTLNIFHTYSSVSIVNFEQVISGLVIEALWSYFHTRKFVILTFEIALGIVRKCRSDNLPKSNGLKTLPSTSNKATLFAKIFFEKCNSRTQLLFYPIFLPEPICNSQDG